jgi:hypothetical protein
MEIIENRRVGRPKTTNPGINERMRRYNLAEKCAAFTPQVIVLWAESLKTKHCLTFCACRRQIG